MGTNYITDEEFEAVELIVARPQVLNAWITGGALLRKDSPDIDVIVHTDTKLLEADATTFVCPGYEIDQVTTQYGSDDGGKDLIIKLRPIDIFSDKRWIDLLVTSNQIDDLGVLSWMQKNYPLDVQCCAWSVFTCALVGTVDYDPRYIMCNSFVKDDSKYLKKYKKYYPDAAFAKIM